MLALREGQEAQTFTRLSPNLGGGSEVSKKKGDKGQETLNSYYRALTNLWIKAFGEGHVLSRPTVIKKLEKVLDSYRNEVYKKCTRKTPKKPNATIPTIRSQNKVWRQKIINGNGDTNSSLFRTENKTFQLQKTYRIFMYLHEMCQTSPKGCIIL